MATVIDVRIWTTKSGEKLRIVDMTDSHLVNTIRMLERKCVNHDTMIYPSFGGEMAQYYAEQEFFEDMGKPAFPPQYPHLCAEADRRGLKL